MNFVEIPLESDEINRRSSVKPVDLMLRPSKKCDVFLYTVIIATLMTDNVQFMIMSCIREINICRK